MSIDHGKVLAVVEEMTAPLVSYKFTPSQQAHITSWANKLRALAQPAEAVESPWIADLRNEAVRGSMKDVYWLSRDQVFELIGDAAGRKYPRTTDATQGASLRHANPHLTKESVERNVRSSSALEGISTQTFQAAADGDKE